MEKQIKIALAGNPNCGKTTLFNALTGSNQFVGNWPGVTVEKGAKVEDCILFRGTTVREAARLSHVSTDKHVELLPGRTMVGHTAYPIVIAKGSVI